MVHRTIATFWSSYHQLPADVRNRADQRFALLKADPRHPSLHFKKVGSSRGREIWSARVTLNYRALAVRLPEQFAWFWIGDHEGYDQMLSSW